jgi:hypothetical protein
MLRGFCQVLDHIEPFKCRMQESVGGLASPFPNVRLESQEAGEIFFYKKLYEVSHGVS